MSYAPWVEFETHDGKNPARPYLQNAINNYHQDYEDVIDNIMGMGFD